jgi:hypothetical protein
MSVASLALFAQKGAGPGGGEAQGLCCCGVIVAVVAVLFLIVIMYLLAVSRCIAQISPRNQPMSPGMVWLCLIPIFGPIWQIIMMFQLADALAKEYRARGMRGDGDFGKTAAVLYLIGIVVPFLSLIGFIMHWSKVSGYTEELKRRRHDEYEDEDEEDDDYDDDDRRGRRS